MKAGGRRRQEVPLSLPRPNLLRRDGENVESYVVRIYRRARNKSRILIGTVEVAGTERKWAFSNIEELWELLKRREVPRYGIRKTATGTNAEPILDEFAEGEPRT